MGSVPTDILRETYFKDRERQFGKRFDQRDLEEQEDQEQDEEFEAATETSVNLWDLESEKELEDKRNGYARGKRDVNGDENVFDRVTSTGRVLKIDLDQF